MKITQILKKTNILVGVFVLAISVTVFSCQDVEDINEQEEQIDFEDYSETLKLSLNMIAQKVRDKGETFKNREILQLAVKETLSSEDYKQFENKFVQDESSSNVLKKSTDISQLILGQEAKGILEEIHLERLKSVDPNTYLDYLNERITQIKSSFLVPEDKSVLMHMLTNEKIILEFSLANLDVLYTHTPSNSKMKKRTVCPDSVPLGHQRPIGLSWGINDCETARNHQAYQTYLRNRREQRGWWGSWGKCSLAIGFNAVATAGAITISVGSVGWGTALGFWIVGKAISVYSVADTCIAP